RRHADHRDGPGCSWSEVLVDLTDRRRGNCGERRDQRDSLQHLHRRLAFEPELVNRSRGVRRAETPRVLPRSFLWRGDSTRMTRDRLPAAVATNKNVGEMLPLVQFLSLSSALRRGPTGHDRGVTDDVDFVVILGESCVFDLAGFPSLETFCSRE